MAIRTVDITATATVGTVEFNVTYIEVRRSYSGETGYAKVKGITQQPDAIELDDPVTVTLNGETLFAGSLKKATQDKEGIVTIEAYDMLFDVFNKLVKLTTEEPRFATAVLQDLYEDADYTIVDDPDVGGRGDVYIAPGDDFPGGDTRGLHEYGSGRAGESLASVTDQITKRLGGVYWVDKNGVVRIEPFPETAGAYDLGYVTEVNSGSETDEKKRVLVKGGSKTSDSGLAAAHTYNTFSPTSEARFSDESSDEKDLRTIQDNNIITKQELDSRAMSGILSEGQKQTAGTVTISGNTNVELFDTVIVPELTYSLSSFEPFQNVISDGRYTVKQVTHTLDSQDGFQTKLNLTPEYGSTADIITGPASFIADQLTQFIESNLEYRGILAPITGTE
jgi:hypothetical protein